MPARPRRTQSRTLPEPPLTAAPETPPLLHTRAQAARLLNCSTATLIRLENQGALRAVKLNKESPTACTYYRRDDLIALASGR